MTQTMKLRGNPLGFEPIGQLLLKFAVPAMISLVVNALYNMVDQIFIGWGVGYLGNGATNVVFPIVVIAIGFGALIGDGAAAYMSIRLGEKKKALAEKGVGNSIVMMLVTGTAFFIFFYIFLEPTVVLFGATDQILPYALEYGYIYIISVPFVIVAIGMNSMIRADGSPKYAMYSMITGALINVVLDAIFVMGLNWGMTGAALATTIGQIIATCISLYYIRKFRHVDVNRQTMKMDVGVSRTLLSYGISSFISQMAVTVVILVINNALVQYGAMSEYGAEIPLTAVGIVMKVNQIITYIIIGIGIGSQPIIGYNYGAKQYQRVKQTMKYAIFAVLATTIIALAAFQIFPQYIVMLFGNENELYTTFAIMTFRISLAGIIFNGLTVVFGIFLQSLGKPLKATIVSLSRQILLLIPAVLILSMLFGVEGILWSIPLADTIAAVISSLLMYLEIRKLNHEEEVEVEHLHELGLDEELNVIHEE